MRMLVAARSLLIYLGTILCFWMKNVDLRNPTKTKLSQNTMKDNTIYNFEYVLFLGCVMKALKSPFNFLLILLFAMKNKKKYKAFRQIAYGKHIYVWQWKLLDKMFL